MLERLAAYGARAAIVSGVLSVIGTVFLLLFFALEGPALLETGSTEVWVPLGRTNDAIVGLAALAAIPLAARLHVIWARRNPGASGATFTIALVALLATGIIQLVYAGNLISSATQTLLIGPLFGGVGAWILAVSLAGAVDALRGRLRWVGVIAGLGYVFLFATTIIYAGSGGADPATAFQNPLFAALAAIGLLGLNFGYPVWAIWLGRRLSREDREPSTEHGPAA